MFTVERATEDVSDYRLDSTGRYTHAENYVRNVLSSAGLESIAIEHAVLRRERGKEVLGLLASGQRLGA